MPEIRRMLLLVLLSVHCSATWTQTAAEPAPRHPIKREVFLTLVKSSLNSACENPQSPYACMVKNVEVCRKNLPLALDQCEKKMNVELPGEIKSEETRQWSTHVARCVVDDYILLAGAANIDITRCPARK